MPLYIHLTIHFVIALLAGYLIGSFFKEKRRGIIFGILGGFFIDLDHVLEYFFVFGPHFNLLYFFESRQFLISEKIILVFHAWEYVPLFLLLAYLLRKWKNVKVAFITLAFAGSLHLVSDIFINGYYFRYYSLIYRYQQEFLAPNLLPSAIYQKNLDYKEELGI